jgi:hypothetical protein
MKRIVFGFVMVLLVISGVYSQTFSRTYNPNLPIAYLGLEGLPPLSANKLFVVENLANKALGTGYVAVLESTSNENGVFTGNFLLSINGTRAMRVQISLQNDTTGDFNYVTAINFTNLVVGGTSDLRYNGTQQSAGQLAGALNALIKLMYDTKKLFS